MLILMNFAADLDSIAIKKLSAYGYAPNPQDTARLRFNMLYTLTQRVIPQQQYTVEFSTELLENPKYEQFHAEVDEIVQCLRVAADMTPYLSKKAPEFDARDPLLLQGGIHHLHLNSVSTVGTDRFVARAFGKAELLFLRIENGTAHLIDIRSHSDSNRFVGTQLLEIVDRNWPHLHFAPVGVTGNVFSEATIKDLRKINVNYALEINGRAINPTMGLMTDGTPLEAIMQFDHLTTLLSSLETDIRKQFRKYFLHPSKQFNADVRLVAYDGKSCTILERISNQITSIEFR
ncbi:hypothetical protein [Collimonas sp.]|jgi:hypothetical protein|uniref:hypothetical protein n=1 Tax=Collimonas sp. TaxID=1963772 RepID=UPI002BC6FCAD|nr:hypothetical protein [Collimonas sp.]HWW07603.1 hypothetical protein [Collimonas sp.]